MLPPTQAAHACVGGAPDATWRGAPKTAASSAPSEPNRWRRPVTSAPPPHSTVFAAMLLRSAGSTAMAHAASAFIRGGWPRASFPCKCTPVARKWPFQLPDERCWRSTHLPTPRHKQSLTHFAACGRIHRNNMPIWQSQVPMPCAQYIASDGHSAGSFGCLSSMRVGLLVFGASWQGCTRRLEQWTGGNTAQTWTQVIQSHLWGAVAGEMRSRRAGKASEQRTARRTSRAVTRGRRPAELGSASLHST